MNKRDALRIASGIAYRFVQQAIDTGSAFEDGRSGADEVRINDALDRIAQKLFEHSETNRKAKP